MTEPSGRNADLIILGDCLNVLPTLQAQTIDLAYLDPPFNTGDTQVDRKGRYHDRWASIAEYLEYMQPRVLEIHRVLKPHGSILLHCDWRTCHHFRLMLDQIFGESRFVNHLIWRYGLGGSSPRRFARKHDDILFYSKGPEYFFAPPMVQATSNRMKGQMKKCSDVIDIPSINNMAIERVGYPTQKPLALLTLLVEACCPPGGCVIDPFCGSGTSLEAAQRTGRHFVGVDCNEDAVVIARQRCASIKQSPLDCPRTRRRVSSHSNPSIATGRSV